MACIITPRVYGTGTSLSTSTSTSTSTSLDKAASGARGGPVVWGQPWRHWCQQRPPAWLGLIFHPRACQQRPQSSGLDFANTSQGIMRATIAELEEHVPAVLAPHFGDATTPAVKVGLVGAHTSHCDARICGSWRALGPDLIATRHDCSSRWISASGSRRRRACVPSSLPRSQVWCVRASHAHHMLPKARLCAAPSD